MILHFSHIGLTDGRTFMIPFGLDSGEWLWLPVRPPLPNSRNDACSKKDALLSATTHGSSPQAAACLARSCQGVRIRGPSAVIAMVNSKWAAREPSWE